MQYRRTSAFVDLEAIRHNIREHQRIIGPRSQLMAVVKADGYGHGAIPVLNEAVKQGVRWAGVSSAEEAIELREAGVTIPVLLMGGWYPEAIPAFLSHQIIPSLYSLELAQELNKQALKANRRLKVHLKLETGMGRLGLNETQLVKLLNQLDDLEGLEIDGVFSHLSSADEDDQAFSLLQLASFEKLVGMINQVRPVPWKHIANSAGTFRNAEKNMDLYRLGISMYGQPTSSAASGMLHLKEALTWKTAIAHLQSHPANTPISYNRTFQTQRESVIATLCVGYADGYSRHLSNNGYVLVKGRRAPIVGRVCMDMTMIDVTDIKDVELHDEVVLIGKQGTDYISATEMASWIGTINYEVVCAISKRVPRIYKIPSS